MRYQRKALRYFDKHIIYAILTVYVGGTTMTGREFEANILAETSQFSSTKAFSSWIWTTLQLFEALVPSKERDRLVEYMVDTQKESVVDGIASIYHKLKNDSQRLQFRQAIGDAVRNHCNDETDSFEVFEDLIYLMAATHAEEAIDALLVLGDSPVGEKFPEYLYETFALLKSLTPSFHVREVTTNLVNATYFDEGYLLNAIGILIKCNPAEVSEVFRNFQPRIGALRQVIRDLGDAEWEAYCDATDELVKVVQEVNPAINITEVKNVLRADTRT